MHCPFCQKMVEMGLEGIWHDEPTCKPFEELDLMDYLRECQEYVQKTQPHKIRPN